MSQTRRFMPELQVTRRQLVLPAVTTGIFHTLFMFAYTVLWVYPLPFAIEQTSGIFVTLCVASFVLFIGTKPVREVPDIKRKLKLYFAMVLTVNALDTVYPAYSVFYLHQPAAIEFIVVLFPIVLKTTTKAVIARLWKQLKCDAYIPEVMDWSVELFHALFITACLQTTTQPLQTAIIVFTFDFMPLAMAYRHVRWLQHRGPTQQSLATIHPTPSISNPTKQAGKAQTESSRRKQTLASAEVLRLRKAVFEAENHLLVEYIECAIPCAYAIYVIVLYHLPNARFYKSMRSITDYSRLAEFAQTTALLVSLQFLSIVAFSNRLFHGAPIKLSCLYVLASYSRRSAKWCKCGSLRGCPSVSSPESIRVVLTTPSSLRGSIEEPCSATRICMSIPRVCRPCSTSDLHPHDVATTPMAWASLSSQSLRYLLIKTLRSLSGLSQLHVADACGRRRLCHHYFLLSHWRPRYHLHHSMLAGEDNTTSPFDSLCAPSSRRTPLSTYYANMRQEFPFVASPSCMLLSVLLCSIPSLLSPTRPHGIANRFPVPFIMPQTLIFFWIIVGITSQIFLLRRGSPLTTADAKEQWRSYFQLYLTATLRVSCLQILYPAYGALFVATSGVLQLFVVARPGLIKILVKSKIASLCQVTENPELHDAVPSIVKFSVELFHALYITNCMQAATAPLRTTLVILLMDFIPGISRRVALRDPTHPRSRTPLSSVFWAASTESFHSQSLHTIHTNLWTSRSHDGGCCSLSRTTF